MVDRQNNSEVCLAVRFNNIHPQIILHFHEICCGIKLEKVYRNYAKLRELFVLWGGTYRLEIDYSSDAQLCENVLCALQWRTVSSFAWMCAHATPLHPMTCQVFLFLFYVSALLLTVSNEGFSDGSVEQTRRKLQGWEENPTHKCIKLQFLQRPLAGWL